MSGPRPPGLDWRHQAAYGLLGAPLAMAALPLFVQIPAYYSSHVGLALGQLGWMLFAVRLFDMLQDPLLGYLIDRTGPRQPLAMALAGGVLMLAFAGLWLPPFKGVAALWWLGGLLALACTAHGLLSIAYLAWGARLPAGPLRSAVWREGAGLGGVVVASLLPSAILYGAPERLFLRLGWYSALFAVLLAVALLALLRLAAQLPAPPPARSWRAAWRELAGQRHLPALLLPYFVNALSVALPATLALFFIDDQLGAARMSGVFLAVYFCTAAAALPLWFALARRWGPLRCWRFGMLVSITGFAGAALLGHGDTLPYLLICVLTGAALGADLALPPVILSQMLGPAGAAGTAFGAFTLLGKLALALAGLALPTLAWIGYQPGTGGGPGLALTYAALPCALKLVALALLSLRGAQLRPPATPSRRNSR